MGKEKARLVKIAGDLWAPYDSLIVCKFTAYPEGGIGVRRLTDIVAAATGWDKKTGIPTRRKLEELDLKYVAGEFERI